MSNSKHAEAAMKFLNLWFSNEELGTLIAYGIEGTHYQLNENGMGTYLEGQDSSSCTYHLGNGISNTNRIRWETENPEYSELLIKSNNEAIKSAALGFAFDTSAVENEITQLDNVCSKYQIGLECGALDPSSIADFNAELKSAGLDTVIAEKQRQLNEFLGK
jgi:putative aldouronate transport system substrate-binding protein